MRRRRLVVIASHPIQYQVPLYRELASRPGIDLKVLFLSDQGLTPYADPGFRSTFAWDIDLLSGYDHDFVSPTFALPGGFSRQLYPRLPAALHLAQPDAVIIHGWTVPRNWLALLLASLHHIPVLFRGETNGLSEPAGIKRVLRSSLLSALFARVTAFLAIGTLNRRFYQSRGVDPSRIFLTPYTVSNAYFQTQASTLIPRRAALRREVGIPESAPVFLFCGKLIKAKRPLDLLDAYASTPLPDTAYLVFAGDGPLRPALEAKVHSLGLRHVMVTGFQNQSLLPRWYAMSDALVLPSSFEPWGLVVNEAMNFGLPVIASDHVGSAPDLVLSGQTGEVFPAGQIPALASSLSRLATDCAYRKLLSGAARTRIDSWDIADTADGIITALTVITAKRPSSHIPPTARHMS